MLNQFKDNIAHIILTLFLILILSHFIFFLSLVKNFKSNYSTITSIDSIVVLTGDKFRISKGMEILSNGIGEKLLLSGVNKNIELINIKNEFPKYNNFFDCCVDIDNISSNTFENSRETFLWLEKNKYNSLLIVSSDYHMPRVKIEFERFFKTENTYYHSINSNNDVDVIGKIKKLFLEYVKYMRTYISLAVGL
jgi:uncharacterized SAM-binding protein YcdF (DUF218 family)